VNVGSSEIVGLIPQKALQKTAEFFLRIENFRPEMILENRLEHVVSASQMPSLRAGGETPLRVADMIRPFVEQVASPVPAPGGGSVAAVAGALGASLGQMAIRITKDKKKYVQYADRYTDALDRLAPYTSTLLELIDADAEAYGRVMTAHKLPKESPLRERAIQDGLVRATEIPSRTANCAAEALRVLEGLRSIIYINVAADLQVGLQMLRCCLRGAIANMRVNLTDVKDPDVRLRYEDMITGWEEILRGN
jgi:formiminotetrahydrofolate cyclodeaminase